MIVTNIMLNGNGVGIFFRKNLLYRMVVVLNSTKLKEMNFEFKKKHFLTVQQIKLFQIFFPIGDKSEKIEWLLVNIFVVEI